MVIGFLKRLGDEREQQRPPGAGQQTLNPGRLAAVRAGLLRLAYKHSTNGILTTLAVALLTAAALRGAVEPALLYGWVTLALVVTTGRLFLTSWFKRSAPPDADTRKWERRFVGSAAAGGAIWGAAGLLMLTTDSATHNIFLMFVIGGMAAGAMSTLTPVLPAYRAYSILAIVPLLMVWFSLDNDIFNVSAFMVVMYIMLILRAATNINASISDSLGLGLENSELVETLSGEKQKIETINRELASEIRERKREVEIRIGRERRLRAQQKALFELASYRTINEEDLHKTFDELTKTACRTLDVHRSSVWLYDESRDSLRMTAGHCADGAIGPAITLERHECGRYFDAIDSNVVVAAADAGTDERTRGLLPYFQEHEIDATLDVSIRLDGKPVGVLRNEHVAGVRHWSLEEQNFAVALSEVAALALGQDHRRRVEEALFREKEKAQVTVEAIGEGIITTDVHGIIEYISPVARQLTGFDQHAAEGRHLDDVLRIASDGSREPIEHVFDKCIRANGRAPLAGNLILFNRSDDRTAYVEITASAIRSRDNVVIGTVLIIHDVSELHGMAQQMTYQAQHDALTGLINRRAFEEQLVAAITSARNENKQHILLYMDLDQFKIVNDTCGHMAGDRLLCEVSDALHTTLRESDNLARLGGDEFASILHGCNLANGMRIAEKMHKTINDFRFVWKDRVFDLGMSVGVALIDDQCSGLTEILSAADAACYAAKQEGRNCIHVYQKDDEVIAQRYGEMNRIQDIRRALDEDRFVLYYQPTAPLNHGDGKMSYCEVLVRMMGEEDNIVPPADFIPAAERYKLITEIDKWVVNAALQSLASEATELHRYDICAINLSGQSLGDDDFLRYVSERIAQTGVAPRRLCFEITETAAIANTTKALGFITAMKRLGCRFALDDFGSGLSSFAYLKSLDIDYLKIDGNFVRDMANSQVDYAMVGAINQMGHVLDKHIIAEFVENEAILERLDFLGVDYAQGYFVGRPQPLDSSSKERK